MSVFAYRGGWKAEIWVGNRKVSTKSGFSTKAAAKKWHDLTIAEFHTAPEKFSSKKKSISFDELLERYERDHLPTIKEGTQCRYKLDINARIKPFFQYRPLDQIDSSLIEQFRAELLKTGLSPKSINNCTSTLRAIFKKGAKWRMPIATPYDLDDLKIPKGKYDWWDKKEYVARFLATAKDMQPRYFAAYLLALNTGMRLGEIVGLSKQDIDFVRGRIHVHRQWFDTRRCYGPPKHNRERFISFQVDSELAVALKEAVRSSTHKEIIFVTSTGARVTNRNLAAWRFQNVIKRAGVPRIRFHDMRHTFASWYMIETGDIWSLKDILGHSDIKTTQRYAHHSAQHQRVPEINWKMTPTLNPLS